MHFVEMDTWSQELLGTIAELKLLVYQHDRQRFHIHRVQHSVNVDGEALLLEIMLSLIVQTSQPMIGTASDKFSSRVQHASTIDVGMQLVV